MAEAHPVAFRWALKARESGARLIHVDPRFSRTSAMCDKWVPIRSGSDIALLGGIIRIILESESYFKEYVAAYTNAAYLVREDFKLPDELAGMFSGWDESRRCYDTASWQFERGSEGVVRDPTLQHPRCVLQIIRRHFQRYTPEMVQRVCGIAPKDLEYLASTLIACSGPDRTTTVCYAVGWTQHTKGAQIIRAACILQMLLGNVGRPGGGVLALRGHASIQGSTDIPTLYHLLPGYLPMPRHEDSRTLAEYLATHEKTTGWWSNLPKYVVSLLKAFYGDKATSENDWGWSWLPRCTANHSHMNFFEQIWERKIEGLFVMGQNPAVGGQNARFQRGALGRLKWLVVRDLVETETASFWKDSPEVSSGELDPAEIATEVFLFPAASYLEKSGTFTNTQRLLQSRPQILDPPRDCRSEAWFVHQLALRLIAKARDSSLERDQPLRSLHWWYPETGQGEPDPLAVLCEINGRFTNPQPVNADRSDQNAHTAPATVSRPSWLERMKLVSGFGDLRDDGSTSCGCWIYSGVVDPCGANKAASRAPRGRYFHGWGFAWPMDRRILYNRASARPDGTPWSDRKKLVWWDQQDSHWTGLDVPDFPATKSPDYAPAAGSTGVDAHPGDAPFVMNLDGLGGLFVSDGLVDGPIPVHYEPVESVVSNQLYPQQSNPTALRFDREENPLAKHLDARYPFVLTTYRLTEHHTAGGMSRHLSHLAELQPELFVELSNELAELLGIAHGSLVRLITPRAMVQARALVTKRLRPLKLGHRIVHQLAMPFHWGWTGLVKGDIANDLIALLGEPNVTIHEAKALVCNVVAESDVEKEG